MSRNLSRTDCKLCNSAVKLTGPIRPILESDCGTVLFDEYQGLLIAEAECVGCGALYLAWVDDSYRVRRPQSQRTRGAPFFDLSFRHSFDDQPAPSDVPMRNGGRSVATYWGDPATDGRAEASPSRILAAHRTRVADGRHSVAVTVGRALADYAKSLEEMRAQAGKMSPAVGEQLGANIAECRALASVFLPWQRQKLSSEERKALQPLVEDIVGCIAGFLMEG